MPHKSATDTGSRQFEAPRERGPSHWELRIKGDLLMTAYLTGAPSQRSTALGNSIDRQAIMGGCSRLCPRCNGAGVLLPRIIKPTRSEKLLAIITEQEPVAIRAACEYEDLLKTPTEERHGHTERKRQLSDHEIVTAIAKANGRSIDEVMREFVPFCPRCRGNGTIARPKPMGKVVDVRETGSSKAPWREFDDRAGEICAFAIASSAMLRVARQSSTYEAALVAYFGTTGERWASNPMGRPFSVYPLTQAGQKLLAKTRNRAGEQSPWDRIWSLASDPKRPPNILQLLHAAGLQAVTLLTRAGKAWDEASIKGHNGQRLQKARIRARMNHSEMARALRVSVEVVINAECGIGHTSEHYTGRLLNACGLTSDWQPEQAKPEAA